MLTEVGQNRLNNNYETNKTANLPKFKAIIELNKQTT